MARVIQTPEQQVYLFKLLGYNYTIEYKSDASNVVADTLSRIVSPTEESYFSLSLSNFVFLEQLKQSLHLSASYSSLLQNIKEHPARHEGFTVDRDLIFFHRKIWLPSDNPFITRLLKEFHTTPLGGHMGFSKTLHQLQAIFFWANMRQDLRAFIAKYTTCQQTKYETKNPAGLLQPLPIPNMPWEDLSLNFISDLPQSQGYYVILVIVDRFSKGDHFDALPIRYTARSMALLFLDVVCKLHGFFRSLVFDRDLVFISSFWQELFRLSGIKLRMSLHTTLKQMGKLRYSIIYWNNISVPSFMTDHDNGSSYCLQQSGHTTLLCTPVPVFCHLKSHTENPHHQFPITCRDHHPLKQLTPSYLHMRLSAPSYNQRCLLKAQAAMKQSADVHQRNVTYSVSDQVYVRLRPYCQKSVTATYNKLSKCYFDPFQVIERIGVVAYRLQQSKSSRIHLIFHVSLLKLHQGLQPGSLGFLPSPIMDNMPLVQPLIIMDQK